MSADARVLRQAASLCLAYPDAELVARVPLLRQALAEQRAGGVLAAFLDYLEDTPLPELERRYVEVFDLSRNALYLSYWTDGDTRRRGEVLTRFKALYRESGYLVDLAGELPDYLPMVLEFAAAVDPEAGEAVLREYRASLELLRIGLREDDSPYADVVAAVCATLPGTSPADRAAVQAMVSGPPAELVGLEPYDPRLLPMAGER